MTSAVWHEEPIEKRHNRDAFDCGEEALNDFLRRYARNHNLRLTDLAQHVRFTDHDIRQRNIRRPGFIPCRIAAPSDPLRRGVDQKQRDPILVVPLAAGASADDQFIRGLAMGYERF